MVNNKEIHCGALQNLLGKFCLHVIFQKLIDSLCKGICFQLRQKDVLLQNALKDIGKMREVARTIVESGDSTKNVGSMEVGSVPLSNDSSYFNSYSHFAIHHEMLNVVFNNCYSLYYFNLILF